MQENSPRPNNVPWLSPYIAVQDADQALDFYQRAFGFSKRDVVPGEDGTTWHAELTYKDQLIMIGKAGAYDKAIYPPVISKVESPISLYLYCKDVDQFHAHALNEGAQSMGTPEDMFWGDRMCRLKDPDGYVWCFATHIRK